MIELATKLSSPVGEMPPLLNDLKPVIQEYMNVLNNSEGGTQPGGTQASTNSNAINNSGIGSIHKTIWSHQSSLTSIEDYIELQSIWNEMHLPILKNFYALKLTILKNHKILNDNDYKKLRENVNCIVELRKLNNKYHKFLKKATDFYYSCLVDFMSIYYQMFDKTEHLSNELLQRFTEEGIIIGNASKISSSPSALTLLNSKIGHVDGDNSASGSNGSSSSNSNFSSQHFFKKPLLFQQKYVTLDDFNVISSDLAKKKVLSSLYNICINIATLNYYTSIMETMNYKIQQFCKVLKWSTLGQFFEVHQPDVDFSRHHLLKSSVYFKCDCYGYAVVCLLRNEQRELANNSETFDMINNMLDIKGDQYKKVLTHLQKLDYMNKDKGNRLIINKEIIEEYFLYCWNEILQKNINEDLSSLPSSDYHYRFEVLKEKISIRYKKNILPIYINILLCVSGALFLKNSNKSSKKYYKFCSDYIVFVMANAILKEFHNFIVETNNSSLGNNSKNIKTFQNHYQYLAFIRVFLQFVANDNDFFAIIIENKELIKVLATFVNLCGEYDSDLIRKYTPEFNSSKKTLREFYPKPKRNFLYQEDLELLHWKDLNLNDFNDNNKNKYEKKTFLNYELLDEERLMMDIPTAKFKSKLEAVINRIIPLVNEFNLQTSSSGDKLKIINSKYCNNNNEILDFALISKDEIFNSYTINTATPGNNPLNNFSSYTKGKQPQRNTRPHSFVSGRENSHSPNQFKQNTHSQRSYSSGSPTGNQNSTSQFWSKRNSASASPSPTGDTSTNDGVDVGKQQKPKMSQRAYSQPAISVSPKLEKKKSDSNGRPASSSTMGAQDSDNGFLTPVTSEDGKSFREQAHTPSSANNSNSGTLTSGNQAVNNKSPVIQNSVNGGNMKPNMFVSWDSNIPMQNNSSISAGMSYGNNHQAGQPFNASGYNGVYSSSSSNNNNIGSSGYMGFAANNYSNGNQMNGHMNHQAQYSNVVNAMNNFNFAPQVNQDQHSLKLSASVPSFTALMGNNASSNSSYLPNAPLSSGDAQTASQSNNASFGLFNPARNGNISSSSQNTASETSPKKDLSWMNGSVFSPQQQQISTVSSNSIWDNNNVSLQQNTPSNLQNISQFNQYLSPSMSNGSTGNASSGGFASNSQGTPLGYMPPPSSTTSNSFSFSNYGQQRPSVNDQSMFQAKTKEADSNKPRFSNIQRSESSGWYNNI